MGSVEAGLGLAEAIALTVAGGDLSREQSRQAATAIIAGRATPAQIAALLVALRMKGETVDEITGFVGAMRAAVERVPIDGDSLVDSCGTGGDGHGTFNISTVAALVAAGAGCKVAKHGNRSVSSRCGSSDLLDQFGVNTEMGPAEAIECLKLSGACFLFAPRYHRATHHAAGPRREIGIRSIFNIVGPLTNPAGARRQLLGVFDASLTSKAAEVLRALGSTHCMVVHGDDGLDEITLSASTHVSELKNGEVRSYRLDPSQLGFRRRSLDEIRGGDPAANAAIAMGVLSGEGGAPREIVVLNAAAVIYVSGVAPDLEQAIPLATESIDSGRAMATLDALKAARSARGA